MVHPFHGPSPPRFPPSVPPGACSCESLQSDTLSSSEEGAPVGHLQSKPRVGDVGERETALQVHSTPALEAIGRRAHWGGLEHGSAALHQWVWVLSRRVAAHF